MGSEPERGSKKLAAVSNGAMTQSQICLGPKPKALSTTWPFPVLLWPRSICQLQLEWGRKKHCSLSHVSKWEKPSIQRDTSVLEGSHSPLPRESPVHPISAFLTHPGEGGGLSACWPPSPCWLCFPGSSPNRDCRLCDPRLRGTGAQTRDRQGGSCLHSQEAAQFLLAPSKGRAEGRPCCPGSVIRGRELAHEEGSLRLLGVLVITPPISFNPSPTTTTHTQHGTEVPLGADFCPKTQAAKSRGGVVGKAGQHGCPGPTATPMALRQGREAPHQPSVHAPQSLFPVPCTPLSLGRWTLFSE